MHVYAARAHVACSLPRVALHTAHLRIVCATCCSIHPDCQVDELMYTDAAADKDKDAPQTEKPEPPHGLPELKVLCIAP